MIKTIFVDLGGVLIENPAEPFIQFSASKLGIHPSILKPSLDKFLSDWQKGYFDEPEFWLRVTSDYGDPQKISELIWTLAIQNCYQEKADVFSLVRQYKQRGYKLALLSNTEAPVAAYIRKQPSFDIFDKLIMSCEIGLIKPNREMFEFALKTMNIAADEAVFIDDRQVNIDGAQALGIQSFLFKDSISDILLP